MTNRIIFYICLSLLIIINLSFTWPLENSRITSTFGESRGDHFHNGIDMISEKSGIVPADEGELVFCWDKSIFPFENYPGMGNYRLLKHKSYYSLYIHLKDNPLFKSYYSRDDLVGETGDTGHSKGKHLHLTIIQTDPLKFVNPFTVFPKTDDKVKPVIDDVYIKTDEKYYRIKNNDKIRITKHYPLLVDIRDSIIKMEKLGIYKLLIYFNGEKVVDNDYSEIALSKDALTIAGKSFDELFDENGYYKALKVKYIDGKNDLTINAIDYSGNETSKKISFMVNLETQ